jgi:hypothetical protein
VTGTGDPHDVQKLSGALSIVPHVAQNLAAIDTPQTSTSTVAPQNW